MIDEESVFDQTSVKNVIEDPYDPEVPNQLSPEWHNYVMGQFTDSELIEINENRYPNCYGLRRVVKQLIGDIISSGPVSFQYINSSLPRTVVHYKIEVCKHSDGNCIEYGDVASVTSVNTDPIFFEYAEETASTRAEGRCLRKLLMINCVAAEELTRNKNVAKEVRQTIQSSPTDGNYDSGGKITDNQLRLLLNKCSQLQIDELKFVNTKQEYYSSPNSTPLILCGGKKYEAVNEVSKRDAIDMIKLLNNYQNNSQQIPKEILRG